MTAPERCLLEAGHDGDCEIVAGPSREDRYEAAVRAVLELCDEADHYGTIPGSETTDGLVDPDRLRRAVRDALLPSEDPDGDREPLVVSGPGAGTERIVREGPSVWIETAPAPLSAAALDEMRRAVVWP